MGYNKNELIPVNEENRNLFTQYDCCDKVDYLIATGGGVIGGLMDIFLVGAPGDSILQNWTDKQAETAVVAFAKVLGWKPKTDDNMAGKAIAFLEGKYKVNYDQSVGSAASDVLGITPNNHHMKSVGHSPDVIGLFFSVLNQFTSTSTFFSDGDCITMDTEFFNLKGETVVGKLFFGFVNWFGHCVSDFSGASTSKGRGQGIVMPFYELFNLCDFGKIDIDGETGTIADLATKVYENGYDARFGIAISIPVVVTDLIIRFAWAIKRKFYHKLPLRECIPYRKYADLRIMLLIGNGTLCVADVADAAIRSKGSKVVFFSRLNMVAWFHLAKLSIYEVCYQLGIVADFDAQVEAFIRVREALNIYLEELQKIDLDLYREETKRCQTYAGLLEQAKDEDSLNRVLLQIYDSMEIEVPWDGDFDQFMEDKRKHLVFQ